MWVQKVEMAARVCDEVRGKENSICAFWLLWKWDEGNFRVCGERHRELFYKKKLAIKLEQKFSWPKYFFLNNENFSHQKAKDTKVDPSWCENGNKTRSSSPFSWVLYFKLNFTIETFTTCVFVHFMLWLFVHTWYDTDKQWRCMSYVSDTLKWLLFVSLPYFLEGNFSFQLFPHIHSIHEVVFFHLCKYWHFVDSLLLFALWWELKQFSLKLKNV